MRGVIFEKDGILYVRYNTEGTELDEVEQKEIELSYADVANVSVGQSVDFESRSFQTVENFEVAVIKK